MIYGKHGKEECNSLVVPVYRRLDAVNASEGYATNLQPNIKCYLLSHSFSHLKIGRSAIKGAMFHVV